MEKGILLNIGPRDHRSRLGVNNTRPRVLLFLFTAATISFVLQWYWLHVGTNRFPIHYQEILQQCAALKLSAGPPSDFHSRTQSDRFVEGTSPVLLQNASIWTGDVNGLEVVKGDLLLDKGLILSVGSVDMSTLPSHIISVDLNGSWVSPGIVDLHSHIGVGSSPKLSGASDTNSRKGLVQPWLRSLDGLNTHDDAYALSISGGLTTAVVLPGSANAVGGQAFAIKLRPTAERSPTSMLLEPPFSITNGTQVDSSVPPRWRIMKQACGENPSRVYAGTRMDTIWAFRQGYDKARSIMKAQDAYCEKAVAGQWKGLGEFPDDLQWEMLVDVLRGRVKIQNHCYEAVDLDGIIRMTNEFKFSISAFHHAHETYLVPDLLKKTYGHTPSVALFATNARYKREAYRGSEFAPRILADNGIDVVMKSDHPVLNSRYLVYEAQQAHYYGLPDNLALASVTTTPAKAMGQDHRIGYVRAGYDADIVVWDSHPLALGATPKQVYIDGIPQLKSPFVSEKPASSQKKPKTPNFDKDIKKTLEYDGLPPLEESETVYEAVLLENVTSIYMQNPQDNKIYEIMSAKSAGQPGVALIQDGAIVCSGPTTSCSSVASNIRRLNLDGGSIAPGLITYGSAIGLQHISGEISTNDGRVVDLLTGHNPDIVSGENAIFRAADGLEFGSRDGLLSYHSGVTTGVVAPVTSGLLSGLGAAFKLTAKHKLEKGAVIKSVTAVHVALSMSMDPSVSTQVATLRSLLAGGAHGELGSYFSEVTKGVLPLVISVDNMDIIASLIGLKAEIEAKTGTSIKMTFSGAEEAHLLAEQIGAANIGVILAPSRPFPGSWEQRRILPGTPLSQNNAISTLIASNVTVGIGVVGAWAARNTRLDIAWAALESGSGISKTEALSLASSNLAELLGLSVESINDDLVITTGGDIFDLEAKVIGVASKWKGLLELF